MNWGFTNVSALENFEIPCVLHLELSQRVLMLNCC